MTSAAIHGGEQTMSESPKISSIEQACLFLSDWFGWKQSLEGPPLDPGLEIPDAIQTINRHLGQFWLHPSSANVLNQQDRLIPPQHYAAEPGGVIPIAFENQGVWAIGYKPDTGSRLWVTGDWPDDLRGDAEWRQTPHAIDPALIFVLLANAVWSAPDCAMDEEDDKPADADCLLWSFAPFAGFSGFWTDRDMSLIRMQGAGWGVTARR